MEAETCCEVVITTTTIKSLHLRSLVYCLNEVLRFAIRSVQPIAVPILVSSKNKSVKFASGEQMLSSMLRFAEFVMSQTRTHIRVSTGRHDAIVERAMCVSAKYIEKVST
jgi:hypothetical protein